MMKSTFVNLQGHLGERFKEHLKPLSQIYDLQHINMDNFGTVVREAQNLARTINDAIFLRFSANPWKETVTYATCDTYARTQTKIKPLTSWSCALLSLLPAEVGYHGPSTGPGCTWHGKHQVVSI